MSIKVHMKERKRRNELEIRKLIRINILDLPTDTVAKWVEHRLDKPWAWVGILASVIFFICSVVFFLSLQPCRSVGPTSTGVCKNSTMLIQMMTDKYEKLLCKE